MHNFVTELYIVGYATRNFVTELYTLGYLENLHVLNNIEEEPRYNANVILLT